MPLTPVLLVPAVGQEFELSYVAQKLPRHWAPKSDKGPALKKLPVWLDGAQGGTGPSSFISPLWLTLGGKGHLQSYLRCSHGALGV